MSLNRPPVTPHTDHSGTTSGTVSTATQLMPANINRIGFMIQNLHATAALSIKTQSANGTDAAVGAPGNIVVAAGQTFMMTEYADPGIISVISATASVPFTCKEWGS